MELNFTPKYPIGTTIWQINYNSRKVVEVKVAKISVWIDENFEVDEKCVYYADRNGNHLTLQDDNFLNKKEAEAKLEEYLIGLIDDDITSFQSNVQYNLDRIAGHQQQLATYLQSIESFKKKIKVAEQKKRKLLKKKRQKELAKVEK